MVAGPKTLQHPQVIAGRPVLAPAEATVTGQVEPLDVTVVRHITIESTKQQLEYPRFDSQGPLQMKAGMIIETKVRTKMLRQRKHPRLPRIRVPSLQLVKTAAQR